MTEKDQIDDFEVDPWDKIVIDLCLGYRTPQNEEEQSIFDEMEELKNQGYMPYIQGD